MHICDISLKVCCMIALKVQIRMSFYLKSSFSYVLSPFLSLFKASEESSLRALESLMTEFFHSCTTNDRKREIGEHRLILTLYVYDVLTQICRVIIYPGCKNWTS